MKLDPVARSLMVMSLGACAVGACAEAELPPGTSDFVRGAAVAPSPSAPYTAPGEVADVVGINSQICSRSGGYRGLSFAIPIDITVKVKDDLVRHGHVVEGRLGVTVQPVTRALAESFGLKAPKGALISSVDPDGAGAKAGLVPGDVIRRVNGSPVISDAQFRQRVARAGKLAPMLIQRDEAAIFVPVNLG